MITEEPPLAEHPVEGGTVDPRRWITLSILLVAVLIAALDSTVLNVAIPTILREFDTTLSSLQWVITGYSLTFASLLIICGRLGDIFGARRMFVVGAALFGVGSLLASLSNGVAMLVIGEAIIEGIGASMMLPASMGIMSSTFSGRERATAFAAWGAVMGAAVAFGPLIGGFLTTNYSWRWAFRINVMIVPFAIMGALLVMRRSRRATRRERLDLPGALLISIGMFLLVFGISEGSTYGWWTPMRAFELGGATVWSATWSVSVVPVSFLLSALALFSFYRLQRYKEREHLDPLFEFSNLKRLGFRYGITTLMVLAMAQVSFLLIMSVVLQDGGHLSAVETGLWLVPSGVAIVIGSQVGGWTTRRIGTTNVVRAGLVLEALGLGTITLGITPSMSFWSLLPGLAIFGCGIGFAGSQLTNVILSDVPAERAGAVSGANSTVRMIGSSLGIAIVSSLLSIQVVRHAVSAVTGSDLSAPIRDAAIDQIRTSGVNFEPLGSLSPADLQTLTHTIQRAVIDGARTPLLFATVVASVGAMLSFLIPQVGPIGSMQKTDEQRLAIEESEAMAEAVTTQ